ncbi:MAG: glucose-6-phosphate isomerase [Elusimicrobia bacterium]|nr:glucose-6-phosphate isomerase [Candidatus Liberimonas magnetica]
METRVRIDFTNCLKESVGEPGLSLEEIKVMQPKITSAFTAINEMKSQGKLGFMELPYKEGEAKTIKALAKKLSPKFENFVVIGIGGSALGNIAVQQALRHPQWNLLGKKERKGFLKLFVTDNVDPDFIGGIIDVIDFKKTLFNIISKSGSTAECLANYFILKKILQKKAGKKYNEHIIVTTDEKKGYLRETVEKEKLLSFVVPSNVGGRFSVLSAVGLLSAAFTGIDIEKLLSGAKEMDAVCSSGNIFENPAAMYATIQYLFYWAKRPMSVMMPYSNAMYGFADWYRQLWAESLGKKLDKRGDVVNVGPTPIKALGATDQHSQAQLYMEGPADKIINFVSVENFNKTLKIPPYDNHYLAGRTLNELLKSEEEATRLALTKMGRPNLTINLPKVVPETVGQYLYMLELATAYTGELFNINAFDQPGVELGKQLTYALMGRAGYEDKMKDIQEQRDKITQKYII